MNSRTARWTLAILAHVALVVAWYLWVKLGNVPKFVMPSPGATLDALLQPNYSWWTNIAVTGTEIFGGYALALVVGVALALVFTWSKTLEAFFMPLLVSLNMIPKVARGGCARSSRSCSIWCAR
jgi:NitT/TauT family transport system permease protein